MPGLYIIGKKKSKPYVRRELLENTLDYKRTHGRYEITDYEAYVRKHKPRRPLIYFENRFIGPTFNEHLAEAETFVIKEKRRKKAELRRLRQKRRRELKLARERRLRRQRRRAERRKNAAPFLGSSNSSSGKPNSSAISQFEQIMLKNPFFDEDDPTRRY